MFENLVSKLAIALAAARAFSSLAPASFNASYSSSIITLISLVLFPTTQNQSWQDVSKRCRPTLLRRSFILDADFVVNSPEFPLAIERITHCHLPSRFHGRIYRMMPCPRFADPRLEAPVRNVNSFPVILTLSNGRELLHTELKSIYANLSTAGYGETDPLCRHCNTTCDRPTNRWPTGKGPWKTLYFVKPQRETNGIGRWLQGP